MLFVKIVLATVLLISTVCYFYAAKRGNRKIEAVGLTSLMASLIFAYIAK